MRKTILGTVSSVAYLSYNGVGVQGNRMLYIRISAMVICVIMGMSCYIRICVIVRYVIMYKAQLAFYIIMCATVTCVIMGICVII